MSPTDTFMEAPTDTFMGAPTDIFRSPQPMIVLINPKIIELFLLHFVLRVTVLYLFHRAQNTRTPYP